MKTGKQTFRSFLLLVWATLLMVQPVHAVLKEKNLSTTLSVLRAELETTYIEQKQSIARYNTMNGVQHQQMVSMMQKSDLISLMLYSQKQDFTFDMTYACHEATTLYREFNQRRMPYKQILSRLEMELNRYDALIAALKNIPPRLDGSSVSVTVADTLLPNELKEALTQIKSGEEPFMLDEKGQADRTACLKYAITLRNNIVRVKASINADNEHYKMTGEKLKRLNDYALLRYQNIQRNIFINGDANYFEILGAFSRYLKNAKEDVNEKYGTEKVSENGKREAVASQWRGPIVTGLTFFVLFYIVVAALLSNVLVRWIAPLLSRIKWMKRVFDRLQGDPEDFKKKRVCLILAAAMVIFAISVMIARTAMDHNFFLMASKLLIEYAWLLCAIFISLLIRLSGDQIKSGFRIYTPIMLMSFIVITFRIIFIPNNLVQLIFPPILLLFTIWQWVVVKKHNNNIPRSDIFYTWISLVIMIGSTFVAWYGYTLMAVQMLIWWMFQLSCIQTVTCIYDLLGVYEDQYLSKRIGFRPTMKAGDTLHLNILQAIRQRHEKYINKTWVYDLVAMVAVPVLAVFTILLSIWWAASVFDLTETVMNIFLTNFLNIEGVVQLSLFKIVTVGSLYFVFRFLNYLIKALFHKYHKSKVVVNGKPNFTLANNVIAICVWGLYFIIAIKMLKIPSTAVSYISAGLATGIGFAMKDLLENFFYGISLMTGRVRVGDFIECDGIRGKVDTITYQSTQIITADGCVIAFLNSSLFTKNFKNITKNHSYELVSVPVGVAYGANVDEVRKMLIAAVNEQRYNAPDGREAVSSKLAVNVVFDSFGDNSVNLNVTYWALVEEKYTITARVKEAVYNTLNAHGIEIPFPQRDLHIRSFEQAVPLTKEK